MQFKELNLKEPILSALEAIRYNEPSPIQERAIPVLLEGRDIIGCAQTGSGKTAAFALPMLEKLSDEDTSGIRGLVLTPTRELAVQICDNYRKYSRNLTLNTVAIYGGQDQNIQVKALKRGTDILVATPGRLMDLMKQGFIDLGNIEMLVLDEADRMLDMGFIVDIRNIIKDIPKERQTVMFSATMPKPIEKLASTILNNPLKIKQDITTHTVDSVDQFVYFVDKENKFELLTSLIRSDEVKNAIVFTNTKHHADTIFKHLFKLGIKSRAIHGDKSQNSRQDALIQFSRNKIKILVATDVAARGIDIKKLSHVINYDIPDDPDSYIHRIGRTGRAGEEGVAISFCCIDEMKDFKKIEQFIDKKITPLTSEWPMQNFEQKEKPARRGQFRKKSSFKSNGQYAKNRVNRKNKNNH